MSDLKERMIAYNVEVKNALQAVYDELNQGQRKKLLKTILFVQCLNDIM